ncbi:gas vesicle protein GvpG [Patescibacteria group bacterium]|nr:gas vesicle protein GvpG [Candidatus Falkowbacteria bacterium]MBU3906026.1 gas vesicle protein GvpG [Patescibacteria group bacterium]MCG2695768.1 gas vesicle protein GvpG [Candidatus Parcubacteria bacterium]MBU4015099.1 gas vesicle protein GvpG [Patescibacteria group bacterium]MBU4026785.1 gas vesicle protein GvpG [Patescibacteria group bacterium]
MFIIDDLLLLPARGFMGVVHKINDMVAEELTDTPEKLKRELLDIQMRLEMEEITEAEYQKEEEEILERLEILEKIGE